MSESQIEKRVVAWCKKQSIYTRKFSSPAHRGVPDRVFVYNHKVVFIEFKPPGKLPTELQMRELRLLWERGIQATWCDGVTPALTWLTQKLICN